MPTAIDIARKLVGVVLDLVGKTVAEELLTDEAIKRQNAIADAVEKEKFGG
jgi:hypothetical protein